MKKPPTRAPAYQAAPNLGGPQPCSGDPACVWPAASLGLCAHHYRMLFEAPLWEEEPDPDEENTVPPELLAQLQADFERRRAAVQKACANPRCENVVRSSNRLGLCKNCGDRYRAFERWQKGKPPLSVQQYLARRAERRLDEPQKN